MMRTWSTKWPREFGTLRAIIRLRTSRVRTRSISRCWFSIQHLAFSTWHLAAGLWLNHSVLDFSALDFSILGSSDCSLLAYRLGWRDHENPHNPGGVESGCDWFGCSDGSCLPGAGWLRGCERSDDLLHDDGARGAAFDSAWRAGIIARLFPALFAAAGASS